MNDTSNDTDSMSLHGSDVASFTSTNLGETGSIGDSSDNVSVSDDTQFIEPKHTCNLHESLVRIYILCFTYGRGRKCREFDEIYKSITIGYDPELEPK